MTKRRRPSMGRRQTVGGWECDAFTGWRRYYRWRPGQIKLLKRGAAKRERRIGQGEALAGARDGGQVG